MKSRVPLILLALMLALSVGLAGCGSQVTPEITEYSLTVSSTEGGEISTPGDGTFGYDEGTVVPLVAFPHSGYRFVNWTGDVGTIADVNSASTTVTMNGDYEITANLEEIPEYNLTISCGEGGSVTAPGVGTFAYDEGTLVDLVATPDAGHCFAEWTGNVIPIADVHTASTTVTMNDHYSITATFVEVEFTDGPRTIYLNNDVVRVGVDKDWGGAIREIWYGGQNLVNNHDGGRLIAVSLYDGGDTYALDCNDPNWGWNPTPSDKYHHVNPPLAYSFEDGILYVKARNLQWNPDNKGGGSGLAVASDVVVETWIKFVSQDGRTISLRYKITYEGVDSHALSPQELPAIYIRTPFPNFISYTDDAPWTDDTATLAAPPTGMPCEITPATEDWAGFVNSQDEGLVFWSPQSYPIFQYTFFDMIGPENPTYYMMPTTFLEIGPEFTLEHQAYFFVGRWQDARQSIYNLNQTLVFPDELPGFGNVDSPVNNAMVSGIISIGGWAIDNREVYRVEIFLDGVQIGRATYGFSRSDVDLAYPGLSGGPNFGFAYLLDTREYLNGTHILQVKATDTSENTSYLEPGQVVINIQN